MSDDTERGYGGAFPRIKAAVMAKAEMTLTEFLLARIAEDEAVAMNLTDDGHWGRHPDGGMWMDSHGHPIFAPRRRALAECEAKRAIVDLCVALGEDKAAPLDAWTGLKWAVRRLATVYADHSDYRDEWRP